MKKTKMQHTETPWFAVKDEWEDYCGYKIYTGDVVVAITTTKDSVEITPEETANANFIVEACNNYERVKAERDDLLEALTELLRENHELGAISRPTADQARAAIAKVDKQK